MTRRKFLKNSAYAAGGVIAGGGLTGMIINNQQNGKTLNTPEDNHAETSRSRALMHFTPEEYLTVAAMVERIYPEDELGSGARDLGAAFYIDHQLASSWGMNSREYMQGPFFEGSPTQGYQGRLMNKEIFMIGLHGVNRYTNEQYDKRFEKLSDDEQDAVLIAVEDLEGKGTVTLDGIPSSMYFSQLRQLTIEGVYSDPLYGGNKNMEGWKMRNYPGAQMSYSNVIDQEGAIKMKPVSLSDHQNH